MDSDHSVSWQIRWIDVTANCEDDSFAILSCSVKESIKNP